jgi:hypothetical protein
VSDVTGSRAHAWWGHAKYLVVVLMLFCCGSSSGGIISISIGSRESICVLVLEVVVEFK